MLRKQEEVGLRPTSSALGGLSKTADLDTTSKITRIFCLRLSVSEKASYFLAIRAYTFVGNSCCHVEIM